MIAARLISDSEEHVLIWSTSENRIGDFVGQINDYVAAHRVEVESVSISVRERVGWCGTPCLAFVLYMYVLYPIFLWAKAKGGAWDAEKRDLLIHFAACGIFFLCPILLRNLNRIG